MISAADIATIRKNDPTAILPGIDTMTGNPYATSSLVDVTKITQNNHAPYYYSPSANVVYVTQAGAVLSGINFGNATVVLDANNVTIKDCTFTDTSGFWSVNQPGGVSGATVENCTFTGSKLAAEKNVWIASTLGITILDNTFLNSPADSIAFEQGVVSGNYFSGEGYATGAHGDAIYMPGSTGPATITNNFIDETANAGTGGVSNTTMRLTDEFGNLNDVTVTGNFLFGAGFNLEVVAPNASYTVTNVSVTNNVVGFAWYAPYYSGTDVLATVSGTKVVDFSNPADSTQAFAAYVAAGLPTAVVVSGTAGGGGATGSAPVTMLGNNFVGSYLGVAGSSETNFVGGYGQQVLFGGQGPNILTYLAIGDTGDRMSAFDPAKDVIDLSRIDGDILTAGVQNFTFIGSAPFSGGAQVRYQLDPTNNDTVVQATLAGDITADFTITLAGLRPLTAANFALTQSQSSAALANGAALSYKPVTTAAGAPTEYAYSNVGGRAYTSYNAFYGSTYEDLAADDLNLSSNANQLVLYDPAQMVTRGGGSETLTVGTGSDPLIYHAVETIDATTSSGEKFVFSAGFGNETIKGLTGSGTTPDSIFLAKSAFTYLTPSMTQSQDLAAVLTRATNTASGVTIADSQGDSLTLAGVTPSMIAANPGLIAFN